MSTIVKRIPALSLALILSFAFAGCANEELTRDELEEIVVNAATANAEVDSCAFDMSMPMTIEIIGGSSAGEMTILIDGTGAMDNANEKMQTIISMEMSIPEQGKQEMTMEIYIVGDWMYLGMGIPGVGEQWMKLELTDEIWKEQDQIGGQIELLETATETNFLGSESVSGVTCYVIEVVPSTEKLGDLLNQQAVFGSSGMNLDLGELDIASLLKEMSFKQWIAKDSYFLMKSQLNMLMEMQAADLGATEEELEKVVMDINIDMELYDYNQPVSISLPEEALQAPEMPTDY